MKKMRYFNIVCDGKCLPNLLPVANITLTPAPHKHSLKEKMQNYQTSKNRCKNYKQNIKN